MGKKNRKSKIQARQDDKSPKVKTRRPKNRKLTFSNYLFKVLKQAHPDIGISSKAMDVMNSLMNDVFHRVASEASRLITYNEKSTMTTREIQTSVRLILPDELAKHAICEGCKAMSKYSNSV